jgi:hypothetical protein
VLQDDANGVIDFEHLYEGHNVGVAQSLMDFVLAFDVFEIVHFVASPHEQVVDFAQLDSHCLMPVEIIGLIDLAESSFADKSQTLVPFIEGRPSFLGQIAQLLLLAQSILLYLDGKFKI